MRIAGKFLENPQMDLNAEIKNHDKAQRPAVADGAFQVLTAQIALPSAEADLDRLGPVTKGLAALTGNAAAVEDLLGQVRQLLQQYLDNKNQLTESLRQQFAPRMRQKEAQIAQQTGRQIKLDPASDPEFAKAMSQNLQRLQSQYNSVIAQAKEQLQALYSG
jgi:ethanolamine utilization microcompartment shell protein EutS